MPQPKIIHEPRTQQALKRGITTLVNAIAPTLGPTPRHSIARNQAKFELLDDGGLIARRIIALPEQEDDVGAMLLRQVLWGVHQHVGDGAATTALLYARIHQEGLRFIAAGANPMRLRARLMELLPKVSERLLSQARPLAGEAELKALAFSVCYDEEMAAALGEVMHTIGQYGQVDVRAGHGRGLEYNYVEGSYWSGGAQSKEMLRGFQRPIAEMHDAAILATDMDIEEPRDLVPLMSLALRQGVKNLLLIVASISDSGLSVVLDKRLRDQIQTIVVKLDVFHPGELSVALEDIALLTGARPLLQKAGESLERVQAGDFGEARWVWADDKNFGFASGKSDPRQLREVVRSLRNACAAADDDDDRRRILERLGRLNGGLATVYVGGIAEEEIRGRKESAERAIRALRLAADHGVLPGGGLALLRCRDRLLEEADEQIDIESRAARLIMAQAVEAPIRQLLANAGYDPSEALARLTDCGLGDGYDLMRDEIVDMAEAGILDVARVQLEALNRAVSSAALALTIDVLVLHREPETMTDP